VYIGLLLGLAIWLVNLAIGDVLFFRADGFVMRSTRKAAAPFVARVVELYVDTGQQIEKGQPLARLDSPEVTRHIAQLSIQVADLEIRLGDFETRAKVLEHLLPFARERSQMARATMAEIDTEEGKRLATSQGVTAAAKEAFESMEELQRLSVEYDMINAQLDELEGALTNARATYTKLVETYADGLVVAAESGTVAAVPAAVGSVVAEGEPLIELLSGPSYILAYARPGGLYEVRSGDPVVVRYGLRELRGAIAEILPIATMLPDELQRAFRPKERAQVIKIQIPEGVQVPPLRTKVVVHGDTPLMASLSHAITWMRDSASRLAHDG
jgi:multidrug resistance efflux pump